MLVTDLNSTNGTFIDEQELEALVPNELPLGAEIIFGESLPRFSPFEGHSKQAIAVKGISKEPPLGVNMDFGDRPCAPALSVNSTSAGPPLGASIIFGDSPCFSSSFFLRAAEEVAPYKRDRLCCWGLYTCVCIYIYIYTMTKEHLTLQQLLPALRSVETSAPLEYTCTCCRW